MRVMEAGIVTSSSPAAQKSSLVPGLFVARPSWKTISTLSPRKVISVRSAQSKKALAAREVTDQS